ncbi:MAG: CDP-alcohol phosphatidyltransferase family protein [Kofleriaceae bacterium]
MERVYLLAPALVLAATFVMAFVVYSVLCVAGHAPRVVNVKHNLVFGQFFASFLVWLLRPLERLLSGRVSANAITVLSLALCAITGFAVALDHLPGAVWLYVFAGIADVLDGRLARRTGTQTPAGALFDSVCDRWGELFVFAGYAWLLRDSPWLLAVLAALAGSLMVSYTRARAEGLGIELSGGVMQRAERVVVVAGGTLIAAWFGNAMGNAELAMSILGVTMLVCGIASIATALGRFVVAYRRAIRSTR